MNPANFKNCIFCHAVVQINYPREYFDEVAFRRKLEIFAYHCLADPKLIQGRCDPTTFPLCLRCQTRVDIIAQNDIAFRSALAIISEQVGKIQEDLMKLDYLKKGGDDAFKPAREEILENYKKKLNAEKVDVNREVPIQVEPLHQQPVGGPNSGANGGVNLQVENDAEAGLDGQDNGEGAANIDSGEGKHGISGSQGGDGGGVENQDVIVDSDDETENQLPTFPRPSPSGSGVALSTEVTPQVEPLPPIPDVEERSNLEANTGVNLQVENDAEAGLDEQDNGEGATNIANADRKHETSGSQDGDGGGVENPDVIVDSNDKTENQLLTSHQPSTSSSGVALSTEVTLQVEPLPPPKYLEGIQILEANGVANLQIVNEAETGLNGLDNGECATNLVSGDGKHETAGSQGGEGGGVDIQDVFQNSDEKTENQLPASRRPSTSSSGVALSTEVTLQVEPLPPPPDLEGKPNPEVNGSANLQMENEAITGFNGQKNGKGSTSLESGDGNNETAGSQGGEGGGVDIQDVFQNSDEESENQLPTSPQPPTSSSGVAPSTEKRSLGTRRISIKPNPSSRRDDDEAGENNEQLDPSYHPPGETGNKKRKLGNNGGSSGRLPDALQERGVNLHARWGGSNSQPVNSTISSAFLGANPKPRYECKFCRYSCSYPSALTKHKKDEHPEVPIKRGRPSAKSKPFICDVPRCSIRFETAELLNLHERKYHHQFMENDDPDDELYDM